MHVIKHDKMTDNLQNNIQKLHKILEKNKEPAAHSGLSNLKWAISNTQSLYVI